MPFIQRYADFQKGGILFTGNTLGLSKAPNQNAAGTEGSIGAFTSLNNALQVNNFPAGTTLDYTQNGSQAVLTLPAGSNVLYAELIWGGLFKSTQNDISALLNNSVTFTTPQTQVQIAPDPVTAQTFNIDVDEVTIGFYTRSANVTNYVQAALSGNYSLQAVPALIEAIDSRTSDTNHAGWTLAVAYEDQTQPLRNITIWAGGTVVSPESGDTTITINNFSTPSVQPITGKIFVSAQEGDAILTGDQMLFGANVASLTPLSGPNNPQNNFFASQINNQNGILNTTGTFGTRNANAQTGTNISAGRQGWDITAIDITDKLTASQTSAVIRFTTDGDLYVPNGLALQIDSKAATLDVVKSADKSIAKIGEEITYTIYIKNIGEVDALDVVINDMLPPELTLVNGSITVDGVPYAGALPVTIATIPAGLNATVEFKAVANAIPANNPVTNIAKVDYAFFPFTGIRENATANSNPVQTFIALEQMEIIKSVDKTFAIKGETLTYTSKITNTGNVNVENIIFTDVIPVGTTFVVGSVYVDGVNTPGNPQTGINIPNLAPGQSATVTFQVIIN